MLYTPAFFALFFANLAHVASFSAFFLFPLYITQHGGSSRDIGLIMGAFACASAFSRPWVAAMIDRCGRKRSYTIGCAIMTLMPLAHLFFAGPITDYYLLLLAVRVLHGVGLAICFTAAFTLIVDLIPVQRLNEGIGIFGSSGLIGLAVGPMIAETILKTAGFKPYFLTASALGAVALLLQWPIRDQHALQFGSASPGPSFFALLKTRKQLICAFLAMLFGIGLAASGNFIAPLVASRQLGVISVYYFAYSIAAVGVRLISGRLADRIGEQQIIPWGLLLSALSLLLLPWVTSPLLLLIAGLLFGLGHGLLFPSINAMAVRNEPYAVRGKVTGIFTGGIDSGAFLGALLLGQIGEYAGFDVLFPVAAMIVLSGLAVFRLRPR